MSGLFDGTSLERAVTCEVCEQPLDQCHCPRDGDGKVLRPADQSVRVGREKRGNGKIVTVITGLDPVASDRGAILTKLKSACAAGGTMTETEVIVQGDHRDPVLVILKEMGYPAKRSGG